MNLDNQQLDGGLEVGKDIPSNQEVEQRIRSLIIKELDVPELMVEGLEVVTDQRDANGNYSVLEIKVQGNGPENYKIFQYMTRGNHPGIGSSTVTGIQVEEWEEGIPFAKTLEDYVDNNWVRTNGLQ